MTGSDWLPDDRDLDVVSAARDDGAETPAAAGRIDAAVDGSGVVAAAFGVDADEGTRDQGLEASRPTGGCGGGRGVSAAGRRSADTAAMRTIRAGGRISRP